MPDLNIPQDRRNCSLNIGGRRVVLTNLDKLFFPALNLTKRDLLQYYADISPVLLPHIKDRAMVMKRYPNGITGDYFFMKRTPSPAPEWLKTCSIEHESGNIIDFPVINDLPALLWLINLGCVDLNQWYARCDDVNRPDYIHFDLDPVPGAGFRQVARTALIVRDALQALGMKPLAKTSGSEGMHLYVPIVYGPVQKEVWTVAKAISESLAQAHPDIITAEYRVSRRPKGRVLVDYNQNAWGRTLASIYSVRPKRAATVSTPVTFEEIEDGISPDLFSIFTIRRRVEELGDLWRPLLLKRGRFPLEKLFRAKSKRAS